MTPEIKLKLMTDSSSFTDEEKDKVLMAESLRNICEQIIERPDSFTMKSLIEDGILYLDIQKIVKLK